MAAQKRRKQYSFSRLDLYDRCPWAYKTVHLDGVPRAESEPLFIGRTLHEMVETYLKRLFEHGRQTDWEWAEKHAAGFDHPEVLAIWSRFVNSFLLPRNLEAWGVEARLAFNCKWQPTAWSRGYFRMVLDWHFRQGNMAVICDWKTSRVIPQTVEKDLQLLTYGWGLRQAVYPQAGEILLRLHFLRYGKEVEVFMSPAELQEVPDTLMDKISRIEREKHFDPKPGSFCSHCGVTAHCPVMAQALAPVEVLAPATREQAEKAAALLLTLRNMEKELTGRLKDWVKAFGPVQVGDMQFGPAETVSYDFDPQQVTAVLLEAGLSREEVWPLLSVTKTSLEKGLRKLRRKDLLDLALKTGSTKVSEKIDFRKVDL
ncbi:MAG: PD-(D/E)XK nuclease family protein [Deltaproteobacteria bacterium]|nr:PD-(D/E)XK nuclease family protein [Deltaproteobacteria bacterium]MBM4287877.1 PD-(D/E)XK nuclease family protein [Deltaproteobacteria bacterium]